MPRTARTPRTPRLAAQSDRQTSVAQPSVEAAEGGAAVEEQRATPVKLVPTVPADFPVPDHLVVIPREEYDRLRKRSIELDHALARESQRPAPKPEEKPKERKFRCKLCKSEFKSFDKRPPCPFRCSYSFEHRTAHGDYITTEIVND